MRSSGNLFGFVCAENRPLAWVLPFLCQMGGRKLDYWTRHGAKFPTSILLWVVWVSQSFEPTAWSGWRWRAPARAREIPNPKTLRAQSLYFFSIKIYLSLGRNIVRLIWNNKGIIIRLIQKSFRQHTPSTGLFKRASECTGTFSKQTKKQKAKPFAITGGF